MDLRVWIVTNLKQLKVNKVLGYFRLPTNKKNTLWVTVLNFEVYSMLSRVTRIVWRRIAKAEKTSEEHHVVLEIAIWLLSRVIDKKTLFVSW